MSYKLKFNRTNNENVVLDIVRGDTIEDSVNLPLKDVPEKLTNGDGFMSLAAYGLLKLVQDRNSALTTQYLSEQGLTGRGAIEARIEAYKKEYDLFVSGFYKSPTKSAGKGSSIDPILAAAIAELKGCDIASATIALRKASKDEREALKNLPKVKDIMDKLRGDNSGEVDLTDLF